MWLYFKRKEERVENSITHLAGDCWKRLVLHAGSRFGKSEAELLVAQQGDEVSSCQQ